LGTVVGALAGVFGLGVGWGVFVIKNEGLPFVFDAAVVALGFLHLPQGAAD
jgi:hypothetical protein